MKCSKIVIVLVVIVSILSACQNKGAANMTTEYVDGFICDDSKPLSQMLTTDYSLQELKNYFGELSPNEVNIFCSNNNTTEMSIRKVNQDYPVECIRSAGYSVYKIREGGYYYVFWTKPIDSFSEQGAIQEADDAYVYCTAYLSSLKKEVDFDSIVEGVSTADDVSNIDSGIEFVFNLSSKTPSYCLLDDGNIMEVCYVWDGDLNSRRDLVVESKTIISKDMCPSRLASILPSDLP